MLMAAFVICLMTCFSAATPVWADDAAFSAVSKQLKARYHAKKRKIPFLGLANFAVKIIRPAGVKSFKLEVFEELDTSVGANAKDWSALLQSSLSPEWKPIVSVYSSKTPEQTHVYVSFEGDTVKLFVFVVDGTEATVVRVKLNPETMAKWMENPKIMGVSLGNSFR
jgi:hypothetical protein